MYINLQALNIPLNEAQGADIASATTTNIGAATGNYIVITGTTTITSLGTVQAGTRRIVKFSGALILTHNATSLILPGASNITTVAGDTALFISLGAGNWICPFYQPVTITGSGGLVKSTSPTLVTPTLGIASATSINFGIDPLSNYSKPTTYSVSWTSSGTAPSLGNGTLTGRWARIGDIVYVTIEGSMGSTTTYGTGTYSWSLPISAGDSQIQTLGGAYCNAGSSNFLTGVPLISGVSSVVQVVSNNQGNVWGQTLPGVWASGNTFRLSIAYFVS